jgi:hypothetical protein
MRTSARTSRYLSSFNLCRSSAHQSKGHDDAARLGVIEFERVRPLSTHPNWQQPYSLLFDGA